MMGRGPEILQRNLGYDAKPPRRAKCETRVSFTHVLCAMDVEYAMN